MEENLNQHERLKNFNEIQIDKNLKFNMGATHLTKEEIESFTQERVEAINQLRNYYKSNPNNVLPRSKDGKFIAPDGSTEEVKQLVERLNKSMDISSLFKK